MIPIDETEARWIRVLRVDFLQEWGDVARLFTNATGRTLNGGGVDGGRDLCRWAATLLGEDPEDAPWN